MNKEEVARIVSELAYTLRSEGASEDTDYIVDPMTVYNQLRIRHPHVERHISRQYSGDPYQTTKRWIPRKPTAR